MRNLIGFLFVVALTAYFTVAFIFFDIFWIGANGANGIIVRSVYVFLIVASGIVKFEWNDINGI